MATFAPTLPQVNPQEWTNVSRPISDIPPDKSKALAIAGVADAIDTGTKVAEGIDQDVIKEKTRAGVESLQQATTLAYEQTRSALIKGQNPDPQAANVAGLSLMKATGQDVPDSLQAGLDRASDLATARAQGNLKANDTLYTGALVALAKQLRAEYPGHKDFIDEQIARISGKNPANAYMDNLLQDVKGLATSGDSMQKMILRKAGENMGDVSVQTAMKLYQAGQPDAMGKLQDAVFRAEKAKLDHQTIINNSQEDDIAGKVDVSKARFDAQKLAADISDRNFVGYLQNTGITGTTNAQLIDEIRQGKIPSLKPQDYENMAQHLEYLKDITTNAIHDRFNATGLSGRLARANETDLEQKLQAQETQKYDRYIQALRDPNKGLFFEMARRAKGIQDNANYQAMTGPMGDFLAKSAIMTEKAGPILTNYVAQQALQKNYLGQMQSWFGEASMKAAAPEDVRMGNVGKNLTADVRTAKAAAANGAHFDPRLYDDLVKNVDLIGTAATSKDPRGVETAKEIVKYMFDPQRNKDFVNQWSRDFVDGNNVTHKGYFAYYDLLTRPQVADHIRALGDNETWQMYKDWQEGSFRKLFGNEVQAMSNLQGDKANPSTMHWDSDHHQMILTFNNKPQTAVDQNYQAWAQDSISRLNNGLRNLGYTYDKEGTEPNEGIFTTLAQLGYKPGEELEGKNLPKQVLQAIQQSQFQPTLEERAGRFFDKSQK